MKSNNTIKTKIGLIQGIDAQPDPIVTWQPVFRMSAGQSSVEVYSDLDLLVGLTERTTRNDVTPKALYFRLGAGLMKKIGIEEGENLLVCYDKDDHRNLMLLKHEKGFKLYPLPIAKRSPVKFCKATIPANWCAISAFKSEKVAYNIDEQKRIIFRLKSSA